MNLTDFNQNEHTLIPLEDTGIRLTKRGAQIPDNLTVEDARNGIAVLGRLGSTVYWAKADLIATSLGKWGDTYTDLIEVTQISRGGLANMMYVWRKFPSEEFRKWDLSPSHYAAVAKDILTDDDRHALLERAYEEQLSRDELRELVRVYGPAPIIPKFSQESFITRLNHLVQWAEANGAPNELLETVREMISDFSKEGKWDFPD